MTVFKRKTTAGTTQEYHYSFMKAGKRYHGVCVGCYDKESAIEYEQHIKDTVSELKAQKSVKALVENFRNELAGGDKIALEDAFDLAAEKPTSKSSGEKHAKAKRSRFADFVAFMKKIYPDVKFLNQVTVSHAEKYINYIRKNGKFVKKVEFKTSQGNIASYNTKNTQLSPATLNRYHEEIQWVFDVLSRDASIQENPFASIRSVIESSEPREAFSSEELEKILSSAPPFIYAVFVVGFFTALREGDISTLLWSDVLWEHGIIRRKLLKTGVTVEIPIMPPLMNFLQQQIGKHEEYVLPDHATMYLDNPDGITYRVKNFLEGIGIKTTKKVAGRGRAVSIKDVHSLRHTFCYFAGVAGIPLVVVQSIVGHMTPEMTSHYTAHADRKTKIEKLSGLPCFSNLVTESRRATLIEQTRLKLIEKIKVADYDTINRIAAILLPVKPKRSLLRKTELETPKLL